MAYVYVQNENDAVEVFQQTIIRAYEGLPQGNQAHFNASVVLCIVWTGCWHISWTLSNEID